MRPAPNTRRLVFLLLAVLSLAACGATDEIDNNNGGGTGTGGGSGSPTPPATTATYVKPLNTETGDQFGFALSLSSDGTTLALSAPLEDSSATGIGGNQSDTGASDSGAVYVYTRGGGTWTQQAYVKASNTQVSDQFGLAVALSGDGNTMAIGTPLEDSSAIGVNGNQTNDSASQSGAVYVFTRTGITWTQQAYVKASNTQVGDAFGLAVALSADGNTLAVGARNEDSSATGIGGNQGDNLATDSGAVYVFTRNSGIWTQQAYAKSSNTEANDWFGGSVSLSGDGDTLGVGARQEDSSAIGINGNQADNLAADSGAVYVFARSGGAWSQQAYVKSSNTGSGDWFGVAMSLSGGGEVMAIGACCEDSIATGVNGNQGDNSASGAGAVYVFTRVAGVWLQIAYLKASNAGSGDEFGLPVALSANGLTLVAGAHLENSAVDQPPSDNSTGAAGAVYVFGVSGVTITQQRFLKAANANASDQFGWGVGVSADGGLVAVSAPFEDSNAIGINGNGSDNSAADAGAAYVY